MKKERNKIGLKTFKAVVIFLLFLSCRQIDLPREEKKVTNENLNKTLDLHAMAIKYEEIVKNDLYTPTDTYNGDLTGYAADCPLCGGTLGCNGVDVLTGRTTTYNDDDYGIVRIVASSKNHLPCGSIVQFSLSTLSNEKIIAIVLDRGVRGTDIDLLVESEDYARKMVGRRRITYDVLRWGYKR